MINYKLVSSEFSGPVQRMVGAGPIVVQLSCIFDVDGTLYTVPGLALCNTEKEEDISGKVQEAIRTAELNLKSTLERNCKVEEGSKILSDLVKKAIQPETDTLFKDKVSQAPALENDKIVSALNGVPSDKQIKEIQSMFDTLGWGKFIPEGWSMVQVQSLIIELRKFLTRIEVK